MPTSNQDKSIAESILSVTRYINTVGEKTFMRKFRGMNLPEFKAVEKKLQAYIIEVTCKEYGCLPEDLKSKYVSGIKNECRQTCFILLRDHLDYSQNTIARIFGKDSHTHVSLAIKRWSYSSEKLKQDRVFIERHKRLNEKVTKKKQKLLKLKQNV